MPKRKQDDSAREGEEETGGISTTTVAVGVGVAAAAAGAAVVLPKVMGTNSAEKRENPHVPQSARARRLSKRLEKKAAKRAARVSA